ncbi:FG-GAP repeat domain-containing protein [Streptomyces sp. NPDC059567]|uniref:FG-GAP repeat domain-containing protein n=1 Tax=Streptomyces sp. NPDC059567 TaxID=3346867 RepID=UPI0036A29F34
MLRHSHAFSRRLATAVGVTLAVTAGTTVSTGPATAAPALAPASATGSAEQAPVPFPLDADIVGGGSSGFLTKNLADKRWTSFADGSSTVLPPGAWVYGAKGSDAVVVDQVGQRVTLMDMSTGSEVLSVPHDAWHVGAVDRTLFVRDRATSELSLVQNVGGTQTSRKVSGVPAGASPTLAAGMPGHALLNYRTGTEPTSKAYWAVLDLATGAVTETHEIASPQWPVKDVEMTTTHLAWVEYRSASDTRVLVRERASGETQEIRLGATENPVEIGLVGTWLTYGQVGGLTSYTPHVLNAVTARSLQTGATRKLLDHVKSSLTAPDGAQLVRGGTSAQGEGLYRISPGADGVPVTTLVASTGQLSKVTLRGVPSFPAVIDLDRNGGQVPMSWPLSRSNVLADVTLRHTRTGLAQEVHLLAGGDYDDTSRFDGAAWGDWFGYVEPRNGQWVSAPNGEYAWTLTAEPMNGIGPKLVTSGTFTVTRKAAPHDYNDNGSPDLLMRDGSGRLWRADLNASDGGVQQPDDRLLASGWNGYNQIEATGNIAGAPAGDFVARDGAGVLWHYLGKGDGTFTTRYRIGSGWGGYNKIAAGSDLNGDGKPDLVATDTAGVMWLYKGTGNWRTPYTTRVKIGTGWNGYNQIAATGNIAGGTAGDLVARDGAGVLWLYLGKGDGTFAPRVRIGAGWGGYSHLVGVGDADRDGRPDLVARRPDGPTYVYKGTGSWNAPFRAPQEIGGSWGPMPPYNQFA